MHCHYGKNIKFFVEKSLAIIFIDILIGLIKLEKNRNFIATCLFLLF